MVGREGEARLVRGLGHWLLQLLMGERELVSRGRRNLLRLLLERGLLLPLGMQQLTLLLQRLMDLLLLRGHRNLLL